MGGFSLRAWQKEALGFWKAAGNKGIVEVVTVARCRVRLLLPWAGGAGPACRRSHKAVGQDGASASALPLRWGPVERSDPRQARREAKGEIWPGIHRSRPWETSHGLRAAAVRHRKGRSICCSHASSWWPSRLSWPWNWHGSQGRDGYRFEIATVLAETWVPFRPAGIGFSYSRNDFPNIEALASQ